MSYFLRRKLRESLHLLGRYPALKRVIVSLIYRFPSLDAKLRTVAHKVVHPEAVLDVDLTHLPEASRRSYDRMRRNPGT
jgi:hypothetical protein